MIRLAAILFVIAFFILALMPPLLLYTLIVGSADVIYGVARSVLKLLLRLAATRVRVEGLENIPTGACVFVANHVSNLDPPALLPVIPRRVAFLAKKEVFRIPILATGMHLANFVPVDRSDPDAAAASLDKVVEYLRAGTSFVSFPEGTRSPDGRLRPFKRGTFVIAIKARASLVPVSIAGTQQLMRKGEWRIHPGEMTIRFGPAVDASGYALEQRGELLERLHAAVAAGLPEEQRPLPDCPPDSSSKS